MDGWGPNPSSSTRWGAPVVALLPLCRERAARYHTEKMRESEERESNGPSWTPAQSTGGAPCSHQLCNVSLSLFQESSLLCKKAPRKRMKGTSNSELLLVLLLRANEGGRGERNTIKREKVGGGRFRPLDGHRREHWTAGAPYSQKAWEWCHTLICTSDITLWFAQDTKHIFLVGRAKSFDVALFWPSNFGFGALQYLQNPTV